MTTDNQKFWTFLVSAILATAVMVLLIDMGIKGSILEESGKLREAIDHERAVRAANNAAGTRVHRGHPPDVPVDLYSGMEEATLSTSPIDIRDVAPNWGNDSSDTDGTGGIPPGD
jgi:hypothetical protein